jgi:tRNA nucleotidyltransferase (CCA-adding enzyme)
MDWFLARAQALGVEHRPPAPILLGRHVLAMGFEPGPAVGRIVKAVYERQLDGAVTDLESALAEARAIVAAGQDAAGTAASDFEP